MTTDGLSQATLLAYPFHPDLIERKPGAGSASYVSHAVITQRFLYVTGPPMVEIVQELYGPVRGKPELGSVLVGVRMRMTVEVDGKVRVTEEYGSCEHPQNETHDGERAKKAASDAYKRCAMRFGNGLQLWSTRTGYTLGERMAERDRVGSGELAEDAADDDVSDVQVPTAGADAATPAVKASPVGDGLPPCPECSAPLGDHTVKRHSSGVWMHRSCPTKKGTN